MSVRLMSWGHVEKEPASCKQKKKKKTKESEMGWNGRSRRLRELWIIHFLLIFYTSLFGIDFLLHFVLFFF
jgi:hypothetical protein